MKIVSKYKLICFSSEYYLFAKGPKLYVSKKVEDKAQSLGILPVGKAKSILGANRYMARGLRLNVRCGTFVDDSIAIVSYHGTIYRVDCKARTITKEHEFRPGMNNPLCFESIQGINGFTDGIYYGEYFLNHNKEQVSIFRRNAEGTWSAVYTFPAGEIYHIHGIIPCKEQECVYILTGDKDSESGIFKATNDFKNVEEIVRGKQAYRACAALPTKNGLIYTTDTPLEENYLYYLDFNTKEIKEVIPIAGPSIYGKRISDTELLYSTSVEPDSRIEGMRYQFSYKLGPGVKDNKTHLYYVMVNGEEITAKEIFTATKDFLPMGAGQFGTIMFPDGEGKSFATGQAVRKYDNKTFSIDI